jgi:hypothetical protein
MKFIGNTNEYLYLEVLASDRCSVLKKRIESSLTIVWFQGDFNFLKIDGIEHYLKKENIILTEFHKIEVQHIDAIPFLETIKNKASSTLSFVRLKKGKYVYFCPLNPTPQYAIDVK